MDIGTSTTLTGYPHIHMLNGYSLPTDKSTVFKYMPLDRFVKMVDKKELVFVSPVTWYDPFEQLYYGIDSDSSCMTSSVYPSALASLTYDSSEMECFSSNRWIVDAGTPLMAERLLVESFFSNRRAFRLSAIRCIVTDKGYGSNMY